VGGLKVILVVAQKNYLGVLRSDMELLFSLKIFGSTFGFQNGARAGDTISASDCGYSHFIGGIKIMNADYMKTAIMKKYNWKNQYFYIATEVQLPHEIINGFYDNEDLVNKTQGDIVMVNRAFTRIYEVEIKLDKRDLKREFETKKDKHSHYLSKDGVGPHYFLFAFPEGMGLEKEEIIPDKYGILLIRANEYYWNRCECIRQPKILPCKKLDIEEQFRVIARRATSEMIDLREEKIKEVR